MKPPTSAYALLAASLAGLLICFAVAGDRLSGLLINSAWLATGTLAVSLLPGIFLAVLTTKTSLAGRRFVQQLLIALLFVPLYVQAAAWQTVLGPTGWLTGESAWLVGWRGAIWVHGLAAIPWIALAVGVALKNIPRELEEEALLSSAPWRVLTRVSLRRAVPGILAASLWIVVLCFGEIAVTDLFQIRTFAEEIYTAANLGTLGQDVTSWEDVPQLAADDLWLGTAAVLMLVLATLAAIWSWLPTAEQASESEPWIWKLQTARFFAGPAMWLLVAVMVGVPVASLLNKAGMQTRRVDQTVVREWSAPKAVSMVLESPWEHRREWRWSFTLGSIAACAATAVGLFIAWLLRTRKLPIWPVAFFLAIGFSIPGPLLAVWLIRLLNHPLDSFWSPLTWCYDHTILAPVLVQFLRALPLSTLVLWSQLAGIPQEVLDSATSEGAGWWRRLFAVVVPMRWPAVIAAASMSLIIAISNLAATLLVAPPSVATLSMRIFGLLHYGTEDRVSALCLALAISIGLLTTIAWSVFTRKATKPNL